ncbi:hypothetical protein N7453_006962 [Penicillium expansum]|nr:hypothetical protein N7453_006962 [Penicillium expansum]
MLPEVDADNEASGWDAVSTWFDLLRQHGNLTVGEDRICFAHWRLDWSSIEMKEQGLLIAWYLTLCTNSLATMHAPAWICQMKVDDATTRDR